MYINLSEFDLCRGARILCFLMLLNIVIIMMITVADKNNGVD